MHVGDICYVNGAYTTLFKNQLILYQGKQNLFFKIDFFFMDFNDSINLSLQNWAETSNNDNY